MKSTPRGIGLIINNKVFTFDLLKNRQGTDKDMAALQRLFAHLGFCTMCYSDLTGTQIRHVCHYIAAIDHKNFDCLMVAILTHGAAKDKLYSTDGEVIPVKDITELFNGYHCPSLISKPKIFLLQFSRGEYTDYGMEIGTEDVSSLNVKKKDITINSARQSDTVISKVLKEKVEFKPTGLCNQIIIMCINISYILLKPYIKETKCAV